MFVLLNILCSYNLSAIVLDTKTPIQVDKYGIADNKPFYFQIKFIITVKFNPN